VTYIVETMKTSAAALIVLLALAGLCVAQEQPAAEPAVEPTEAVPGNYTEPFSTATNETTTLELPKGENTTITVEPGDEVRLIITGGDEAQNITITNEEPEGAAGNETAPAEPGAAPTEGEAAPAVPANVTIIPRRGVGAQGKGKGKAVAKGAPAEAGATTEAAPGAAGGMGARRRLFLF